MKLGSDNHQVHMGYFQYLESQWRLIKDTFSQLGPLDVNYGALWGTVVSQLAQLSFPRILNLQNRTYGSYTSLGL